MMNNKYIETRATHKTNGNGNYLIMVIVTMVCVTVLGAAYMISNGLKSAGSAEAVTPVVVAAAQDTSDEAAAVPEAAIADEAVEEVVKAAEAETEPVKELVVKDTTPLYQLEPVNAVNDRIPDIEAITDAWGNEFDMAFDLWRDYEWTYQTGGEYDVITGTIFCADNSSGDYRCGTLEIYDGDTDTLLWQGDMKPNMKSKEFEVELDGAQLVTFKFINHTYVNPYCGLADVEFVSYED